MNALGRRSWLWAVGLVLVAAGGAVIKRTVATPTVVRVAGEISTGSELVFVFIASSSCAGIKDPSLPEALARARAGLKTQAERDGHRFVAIGVSLDWHLPDGIQMLEEFGPFDEILVGRGWLNTGAVRYIWEDIRGAAAIPQVVVTTRGVVSDRVIEVGGEELVVRKAGARQIADWSSLAFPDPLNLADTTDGRSL